MTVALEAKLPGKVIHIEMDGKTKAEIQRKVKRWRSSLGIGKQQLKWKFVWMIGEEEKDEE